jgi:ribosomal-protein-alanine N-acetyltransferase
VAAPPRATIPKLSELTLEITTPRLRLRPWTASDEDVDAMWRYAKEPEFPKLMSWEAHRDKAETRAFLEHGTASREPQTGVAWAIEHAGATVGSIALMGITWQHAAWRVDRAELGFWLGTELWGKGLMTEAARHVLLFGFDSIGLHKITTGCLEQNIGSRRVLEKVGFRLVGRRDEDVWRDGAWHAHLRYELTAAQWSDVSTTMPISRPHRT